MIFTQPPRAVALAACAALCTTAPAFAADVWVEVRSPNFIVVSNAGVKDARSYAVRFEEVRAVFVQALANVRLPRPHSITIIIARDGSTMTALQAPGARKEARGATILGYSDGDKAYIVIPSSFPSQFADDVAMGLYSHDVTRHNFGVLPYWLYRGITAVFSATKLRGPDPRFGAPQEYLDYFGFRTSRLSLDKLIEAERSPEGPHNADLYAAFRAKAWAVAHYLMLSGQPSQRNALQEVLRMWRAGKDSREALQAVMGDLRAANRMLDDYVQRRQFRAMPLRPPPKITAETVPARPLTPAQVEMLVAEVHLAQREPATARPHIEKALLLAPEGSAVHEGLGRLLFAEGNHAAAVQSLDRALEFDPDAWRAHYYRGRALAALSGGAATSGADAAFQKAIQLAPDFAPAYEALASLFLKRGTELQNAVRLAERALELDPASQQAHLTMGRLLVKLGRPDLALLSARLAGYAAGRPDSQGAPGELKAEAEKALSLAPKELATASVVAATEAAAAPSESKPELKRRAVPADPTRGKVQGKVVSAKCSGFALDLAVEADGQTIILRTDNFLDLEWWGEDKKHPALRDPCAKLPGTSVTAAFRIGAAGQPGQVHSIGVRE
jgi:tetratricopeptide (TPR) repeat protein